MSALFTIRSVKLARFYLVMTESLTTIALGSHTSPVLNHYMHSIRKVHNDIHSYIPVELGHTKHTRRHMKIYKRKLTCKGILLKRVEKYKKKNYGTEGD